MAFVANPSLLSLSYVNASVARATMRAARRPIELTRAAPLEAHKDVVDLARVAVADAVLVG